MLHYNDLVKVKSGFYKGDVAIVQNALKQEKSGAELEADAIMKEQGIEVEDKYTYLLKFLAGNQEQFQEEEVELLEKEVWMKEKKEEDKRWLNFLRRFFSKF